MSHRLSVLTAATACSVGLLLSPAAQAQSAGGSEVSATGKGITGGALLGAEVVLMTEAIAGVRPGWAYAVGGGAGAIGGGVGGFFVEDLNPKISLYMLAGGLALVIPTTVAVLSATAYEPPANYTEDRGPLDEAEGDDESADDEEEPDFGEDDDSASRSSGAETARSVVPARPAIPALLGYDGALTLSMPAVEVTDLYTRRELAQFGVRQGTELRVHVLNVVF